MKIQKISAITLKTTNMKKSYEFYSKIPGLILSYGGPDSLFSSFEIRDDNNDSRSFINLEYSKDKNIGTNFGRIIIYSTDVDNLYQFFRNNKEIYKLIGIRNKPRDANWGERYFHISDPNGYEISFAQLASK